ncbi:unnamed protein product [Mycena citricolor]|uniref:IBR domain-containing protein n=1 Tax=Mycena citricolor TaxID=2018698 RepID=A0AAD2K097_9AGAR|nr:unnamed protein product [Mycena citricolor]
MFTTCCSLPELPVVSPARFFAFSAAAYGLYVLLYRVLLYPRFFSPLRHVPGPPLGNPLLGHYLTIVKEETCIPQKQWVAAYGPFVRFTGLFGDERLVVLETQALKEILVNDWLDYPRPQFMRDVLGLVAGYGLLTITGDEHKSLRKAMNPAFSIANLMAPPNYEDSWSGSLVTLLSQEIEQEPAAADGKVFMVYEWMGKVTLDIICDTAFGYEPDCLHNPHNELAVAFEGLLSLQSGVNLAKLIAVIAIPGVKTLLTTDWMFEHRHLIRYIPFLSALDTLVGTLHTIRRISRELLLEKTTDLSVSPDDTSTKKDIMSLLVRQRKAELDANPRADAMSDRAMVDQVLTFLAAGHETTATGITWTLWLLANDPASQHKLREEVTHIYALNPRPDYRTLKSLTWLDCVVNEGLRVLPPVPLTMRKAAKTDYVAGVLVPEGTVIQFPIRVINTWKQVWGEDADEFRPGRWLDLPKAYNATFSQFSFIAGPHGCIGKTMAVSEMKAVISALVYNFEFSPAYSGQIAHPAAAITMRNFEPPGSKALRDYVQEFDDRVDPNKRELMRLRQLEKQQLNLTDTFTPPAAPPPKPKGPKCSVCFKHIQVSVNPWQLAKTERMMAELSDDSGDEEEGDRQPRVPRKPVLHGMQLATCKHYFCGACLAQAIYHRLNIAFDPALYGTALKENKLAEPGRRADFPISCPTCQVKPGEEAVEISDVTARLVLGQDNMDEWNHARFLSSLNLIYCPHKGCDECFDADDVAPAPSGVEHADTLVQCPRCRGSLCKACKSLWHENLTCQAYQALPIAERAPEDIAFANLAEQEKWRRCPKCSAMVELKVRSAAIISLASANTTSATLVALTLNTTKGNIVVKETSTGGDHCLSLPGISNLVAMLKRYKAFMKNEGHFAPPGAQALQDFVSVYDQQRQWVRQTQAALVEKQRVLTEEEEAQQAEARAVLEALGRESEDTLRGTQDSGSSVSGTSQPAVQRILAS